MSLAEALLMLLGGVLAGVGSLVIGGVGGMWQTRRAVQNLADLVGDLQVQVQREVKRRAGEARHKPDTLVEELARRAQEAPGPAIEREPDTPAGVLAVARRRGVIR